MELREAAPYRVSWTFRKDESRGAGADTGWIDDVRVSVDGADFGKIAMNSPEVIEGEEDEEDSIKLSWPTLPCRHYQVWSRPKNSSIEGKKLFTEIKPATGVEQSTEVWASLHQDRDYYVTLVEPPSFTRTPPSQDFAEREGDPLTLAYEAEGSGDIRFTWRFRGANDDWSEPLPIPEDGREIASAGKGSILRIDSLREAHEGNYTVVAENAAGREPAPPISVAVFQPPRLKAFMVRAGEEPEYRIVLGDTGITSIPALSVNAGERIEIDAEIGGSGSIEAVWERQEADSGDWLPEGTTRLLWIERAAPEHAGLYRLNLESRWGAWEGPRIVAVDVISPPTNLCVRANSGECLIEGSSLAVDQFEPLTLSVEADGTPEFTYQWYRTGDLIPQKEGGQSPTLSVSTEQGGVSWYEVKVTNPAGFLETGLP